MENRDNDGRVSSKSEMEETGENRLSSLWIKIRIKHHPQIRVWGFISTFVMGLKLQKGLQRVCFFFF